MWHSSSFDGSCVCRRLTLADCHQPILSCLQRCSLSLGPPFLLLDNPLWKSPVNIYPFGSQMFAVSAFPSVAIIIKKKALAIGKLRCASIVYSSTYQIHSYLRIHTTCSVCRQQSPLQQRRNVHRCVRFLNSGFWGLSDIYWWAGLCGFWCMVLCMQCELNLFIELAWIQKLPCMFFWTRHVLVLDVMFKCWLCKCAVMMSFFRMGNLLHLFVPLKIINVTKVNITYELNKC